MAHANVRLTNQPSRHLAARLTAGLGLCSLHTYASRRLYLPRRPLQANRTEATSVVKQIGLGLEAGDTPVFIDENAILRVRHPDQESISRCPSIQRLEIVCGHSGRNFMGRLRSRCKKTRGLCMITLIEGGRK